MRKKKKPAAPSSDEMGRIVADGIRGVMLWTYRGKFELMQRGSIVTLTTEDEIYKITVRRLK